MKSICQILTVLLLVMTGTFALAQNINVFNYQAVAHDAQNDTVLRNKSITVDFYIGTDNLDPTNNFDYSEEHQLTTNNYGLFNVQIGNEDPQQFEALEWANESYYLTVTIDNELINSQLIVAVPHAIYAQKASEAMNSFMVNNLSVESDVPPNANFTDNQTLSLSSDSLIISDGNAIAINDLNSADNDWIVTGNNIENANSGKVGIGNTTLFGKLNITTDANTTRGLYVINSTNSNGSGITGEKMGVYAMVDGGGSGDNTGAWFDAAGTATGINIGVGGYANGSAGENRGVYGAATNGPVNWAGYFDGNVKVSDELVIGTNNSPGQIQYKDGNQGFGKILRSDAQGNAEWSTIGALAAGVMVKPVYDSNNNAIVDNAELVNGYQVNSNVPAYADFTDDQTISLTSNTLSISNGNSVDLSNYANQINIDNDTTNEIQSLTITNNTIQLSKGGGAVTVPNNIFIDGSNVGVATTFNTTGDFNTATGSPSLVNITSGTGNSAYGDASLINTTTGSHNSAFGRWSSGNNSTGSNNSAFGHEALKSNASGSNNSAFGDNADVGSANLTNATAIGSNAIVNVNNALVLGDNVDVGIGNSSPSSKLDIVSSSYDLLSLKTTGQNSNVNIDLTTTGSGKVQFHQTGGTGGFTFIPQGNGIAPILSLSSNGVKINNEYTLPKNDGNADDVLTTDGNGNVTWQGSSTAVTLSEINLSPHDFTTTKEVSYGGYNRNVIELGNGGGTMEGHNHYDFPTPSDWNGTSMTVTVYYSGNKNDGNFSFSLTGESYTIGQSGYLSTGANSSLSLAQPYTLYSYTKTLYFAGSGNNSDLLSIMFSRYDYRYQGQSNPDTNTGLMYIHGIRISYPTN